MENIKNEIAIYQSESGAIELRGDWQNETIWVTQAQIANLFEVDRTVVTKHIRNILKIGELDSKEVCAKFAHTATDGKTYQTQFYNIDVVLAVGYRVNSKIATKFRRWATTTLKEHIFKGVERKETNIENIVGNVFQSFGGEYVYPTVEENAANLLYFFIKNHPFIDGNKRSGAFAFIWFLQKAGLLNIQRLSPNVLTALTLLIAESNPKDKDRMIGIILLILRGGREKE